MNVYQKLAKVRDQLQDMDLKKSGKNDYSNFTYYELGDFLPPINKFCESEGLLTVFNLEENKAILSIINVEEPSEVIHFHSPTAKVEIGAKSDGTGGAQPIQNLGGKITYLRRYLLMTAFEIAESDIVEMIRKELGEGISEKDEERISACKSNAEASELFKELQKKYKKSDLIPLFEGVKERIKQDDSEGA